MNCPRCGGECERDEADIGVGTQYGPWRCPDCGWGSTVDDADPALRIANDDDVGVLDDDNPLF